MREESVPTQNQRAGYYFRLLLDYRTNFKSSRRLQLLTSFLPFHSLDLLLVSGTSWVLVKGLYGK